MSLLIGIIMLEFIPKFNQNQIAHILTLTLEQGKVLKPHAFLSGAYANSGKLDSFYKEILPHLDGIVLYKSKFATSLSTLQEELQKCSEQSAFWGYLAMVSFRKGEIFFKYDGIAPSVTNFIDKLSSALSKQEIDEEYIISLFMGFMGELIRSKDGLSAMIIHNFLHLVKAWELADENKITDLSSVYSLIADCLLDGLKLSEKLPTSDKEGLTQAQLMKIFVKILMTSWLFNAPYKREFYEDKVYPTPSKMSLMDKFKQLKVSWGENKKGDKKKYATTGMPLDSISSRQQNDSSAELYDANPRKHLPNLVTKKPNKAPISVPKQTFDPRQMGFSYINPTSLPSFNLAKSHSTKENSLQPSQQPLASDDKNKIKLTK
jgi:hypothetical protein